MTARLLEGRPAAEAIWVRAAAETLTIAEKLDRPPTLRAVVGTDAAAQSYARQIQRGFERHGLVATLVEAPTKDGDLRTLLRDLAADTGVDGVIVMTPLPGGQDVRDVALDLDPRQDVDGIHPVSAGRLMHRSRTFVPSTALGGLRLLQHYAIQVRGRRAVVVGRSPVVGLPLALLLLHEDATVSVCHSRTANLAEVTRTADILCVAAGRPGLVGVEHVRPGAVVLDFGTNPTESGLVGDVQTDAVAEVASAITPVPGGTGPMTVAVLAEQTAAAARARLEPNRAID